MKKKLKTSADYPQFYFRIDIKAKKEIEKRIKSLLKIQKEKMDIDDYQPKRNELIIKALEIGLDAIEKDFI